MNSDYCILGQKGMAQDGATQNGMTTRHTDHPSKIFVCKIFLGQNFYMFTCSLRHHNRRNLSKLLQINLKCSRTRVMSTTPMLQIGARTPTNSQHRLSLRRDEVDDTQYHILYSLLYD